MPQYVRVDSLRSMSSSLQSVAHRDGRTFYKGPDGESLGFVGQMVSVRTKQLCCRSTKAVTENIYVNGCGSI